MKSIIFLIFFSAMIMGKHSKCYAYPYCVLNILLPGWAMHQRLLGIPALQLQDHSS